MNYGAATSPRRGLLPAAALGLALAGCGIDAGRTAADPVDPAPPAAPAPGGIGPAAAVPARSGDPAVAAAPATTTDPATTAARGSTTAETQRPGEVRTSAAFDEASGAPEPPRDIVYHVVKGARFFDILVARIGNREHIVIGETDDMCLDLPDQRDFDGDGIRDALVFRSPRCRGDAAPGLLFFVSADTTFRLSNPFPGHRPRVERWNGEWSVLVGETRHVLRDGRAVPVNGVGSASPRERESGRYSR